MTDDQAPGTSAAPTSQQSSSSSNARLEISGQDVLDEMTSTDVTKNRTQDNADMTQYAQRERRPTTTLPRLPGWETDDDDSLWELVSNKKPGQKRAVLYIGGLSPSTSEDKLIDFAKKRAQSRRTKNLQCKNISES